MRFDDPRVDPVKLVLFRLAVELGVMFVVSVVVVTVLHLLGLKV